MSVPGCPVSIDPSHGHAVTCGGSDGVRRDRGARLTRYERLHLARQGPPSRRHLLRRTVAQLVETEQPDGSGSLRLAHLACDRTPVSPPYRRRRGTDVALAITPSTVVAHLIWPAAPIVRTTNDLAVCTLVPLLSSSTSPGLRLHTEASSDDQGEYCAPSGTPLCQSVWVMNLTKAQAEDLCLQ
jgi:hypothetical protein